MDDMSGARITPLWEDSALTVRSIDDPVPNASLCSTGAFAVVDGPEVGDERRSTALLTLPISGDVEDTVDWISMRVFAIDEHGPSFGLIERSGFDREQRVAWAEIDAPGIYGAYALPRHPAVRDVLLWLQELHPLIEREEALGQDRFRTTICQLILCENPTIDPPEGICERCLGLEIPPLGLPEFRLIRRERLAELVPVPKPCRLVNGPIAFVEFTTGRMLTTATLVSNPTVCATPAPTDHYKPPRWSSAGERIAYAVREAGGTSRLETRDNACGDVKAVISGSGDWSWVSWNPVKVSGKSEISFGVGTDVGTTIQWRIDAVLEDGTNRRTLVAPTSSYQGKQVIDAWAQAYSPSGNALAFVARLSSPPFTDVSLVVTDPSGASAKFVTPPSFRAFEPVVWTKDGKFVGVRTGLAQSPSQVGWAFFPVNAAGTPTLAPLAVASPDVGFLSFAPDSLKVCGTRTTPSTALELFAAEVNPQTLAFSNVVAIRGDCFGPDWGPTCVV